MLTDCTLRETGIHSYKAVLAF